VLAAIVVGLSSRTILQVDVGGMLALLPFLGVPLIGGLRATQEAARGWERLVLLVALVVAAVVIFLQPGAGLGAPIPLFVALALAFPTPRPRPYGAAEPEARATLADLGEDREE